VKHAFLIVLASFALVACQPSNPPPTPLPTKEKTVDKVKNDVDQAMKKAQETRDAEDKGSGDDLLKKGY
jgi:hypothetical protein